MAIDITTHGGEPIILEPNRGDIGTLVDINNQSQISIKIPAETTNKDYVYIS